MTKELYFAQVRKLLCVKVLPMALARIVNVNWINGNSAELAADDCILETMKGPDSTPHRQGASHE